MPTQKSKTPAPPVQVVPQVASGRSGAAPLADGQTAGGQASARKISKILVIDDDSRWAGILTRCAQEAHRDLVVLNDPSEALRRLETEPFDLVITDRSKEGDPYGDRIALKARERNIPCIMVSGDASEVVDALPSKLGLLGLLKKDTFDRAGINRLIAQLEEQR